MLAPIRWSVLNAHGREHTLAQRRAGPTIGGHTSCIVLAETTSSARYVPQLSALAHLDYLSREQVRATWRKAVICVPRQNVAQPVLCSFRARRGGVPVVLAASAARSRDRTV